MKFETVVPRGDSAIALKVSYLELAIDAKHQVPAGR